jgi:surface protein
MTEINLPEEPPLVPPSLYNDEGETGIEFRSSFLFQSSKYLPEDGTESGSSGTFCKNTIKNGKQQQTSEWSSEGKNKLNMLKRIEPPKKKASHHHHVVFKNPPLSVCGEEKGGVDSWRGFRVMVPTRPSATATGQSTAEYQDNTASCAQSRAGMSTLTLETAFLSLLFPKSKKRQWACAVFLVLLVAASVTVIMVCEKGHCRRNKEDSSSMWSSPVVADSPSAAPSLRTATNSPTPTHKVFATTSELYTAVDEYLRGIGNRTSEVAIDYGYPIGVWDVSQITNFSNVFDSRRNPLVLEFSEDLIGWDTSRATNMEGMFYGAESFGGDLSSWDTSRVTNMKEMMALAQIFNGNVSLWDVSRVETMEGMCKFVF